jgi:hypothetical protein
MGTVLGHRFLGVLVVASVSVSWTPFHSSLYPYRISQPSSFKHVALTNTANQQVDFFFPSIGSFPTNVNIVATPSRAVRNRVACPQGINGYHAYRRGWLTILGQREALMHADFHGLAGKYSVEQVCLVRNHTRWQLTVSYEAKYRTMRSLMLRMLASFHVDS